MKWFVAAIVILVVALVFNLSLLAYAMYGLLGVLILSRFVTFRWTSELSATRKCDVTQAKVGEVVQVQLEVKNGGVLPISWALLEDLLPPEAIMYSPPRLAVEGRRVLLASIGSRATKKMEYQFTCNRRGYYQVGPMVMETGDLFGLHRRYKMAAAPHFVMVLPSYVPLSGYAIASRRPIGEVKMTYRLYEDPTRIAGVRVYERGDALNRIHWKATARTGTLHSKIFEPSTVAGATIMVDFHKESYPRKHEPFRSELAITAAASIANALFLMGQQIGIVTNARDAVDRITIEGWRGDYRTRDEAKASGNVQATSTRLRPMLVDTRRGDQQLQKILELLARMELTDGLKLAELTLEAANRMPRDATVVAILSKVTAETALALGMLRKRGFAVSAIISTQELSDFADASGPLLAEGIETRHLRDEQSIVDICRQFAIR